MNSAFPLPPSGIIRYGREWEFNAPYTHRKTGKGKESSPSFCISVKRAGDNLSFPLLVFRQSGEDRTVSHSGRGREREAFVIRCSRPRQRTLRP